MFDAADKMAAQYEAGYRPPGYRAENGPPGGGDRTESRQESRESELTGLRERAAADRAELADLARDDHRPNAHADDGPREVHDAERGSDQDGTDDAAPPADRSRDDDPKEPGGADGDRGNGDGPNKPPPPDGPDDRRDSPDELAALRAENAALRAENAALRKEAADAKAAQAEAEGKLADANAQIKEKDAWIGELKNTVLYMDRKLETAEARADEQNAKIDTLTGTVGELTGKVDQLGTMLGDALKQMKSPDQATPEAGLDRPAAPGADLAETHRPEFLPAPETVRSPADKLGGRELADEVQAGDKQRPPWYHRGPQSPTLTWTSGTISTVLTAVTHYMPPGPSFAAIISGYVTLDVLGPEWPTDEGLRELAKRVARAKIDVDLDESKIHSFLRTSAIGFQSLDRVFTDRQEMMILPILIAASLLLAFHPRDQEIWEYLNDIEEALEAADSVKPSVYPAMILAAHRHEASKAR